MIHFWLITTVSDDIKKILVVGGAGYIGSHMTRMLRRHGRAVAVFDDLSTGHAEAVSEVPLIQGSLLDADAYERLDSLGSTLQARFESHVGDRPLEITRAGSLLQIHDGFPWVPDPPAYPNREVITPLHLSMYLEGLHTSPRGFLNVSLAMEDEDVEAAAEAFRRALQRISA